MFDLWIRIACTEISSHRKPYHGAIHFAKYLWTFLDQNLTKRQLGIIWLLSECPTESQSGMQNDLRLIVTLHIFELEPQSNRTC